MTERLEDIAARMVAPGKGILAADESSGTCTKRFEALGIVSTPDSRRDYRELFFRSGDAMRNFVSGVILYDETIRQNAKDGTPLVKVIAATGAVPGIKLNLRPVDDLVELFPIGRVQRPGGASYDVDRATLPTRPTLVVLDHLR